MPKIFISYRRADSQYIADRIHDYMSMHFDDDNVFQDVGDIPFGVDFRAYLQKEIDKCDTVLVIIGPDWARIMQERTDQSADFVRIEVEMALQKNKLVIPVLVNDANMPSPSNLPESIQQLCYNNAAKIRPNPDFKRDCELLASNIEHGLNFMLPSASSHEDFLPKPFDWCYIPSGNVTLNLMSGTPYFKRYKETYHVSEFWIGKYPITNAQFRVFYTYPHGYSIDKWWKFSDKAIQWKNENDGYRKWSMLPSQENFPAVVTWFEAMAYCNWLTNKLERRIFLPTEQHWTRAARGDKKLNHPWGDEYDPTKLNENYEGLDALVAVDSFPQGASEFGVIDLLGNVWEWCSNDAPNDIDINEKTFRKLRGGSSIDESTIASPNQLADFHVTMKGYEFYGFRIASSF